MSRENISLQKSLCNSSASNWILGSALLSSLEGVERSTVVGWIWKDREPAGRNGSRKTKPPWVGLVTGCLDIPSLLIAIVWIRPSDGLGKARTVGATVRAVLFETVGLGRIFRDKNGNGLDGNGGLCSTCGWFVLKLGRRIFIDIRGAPDRLFERLVRGEWSRRNSSRSVSWRELLAFAVWSWLIVTFVPASFVLKIIILLPKYS